MESRHWTGDDNRDSLAPDPDAHERCPDCGEHVDDGCAKDCGCKACRDRDAAEPPEPDGEAFRGGEAAGYLAEQQAAAMRLKR